LQRIEVPANGALPPLKGAIWYPCAKPSGEVKIGTASAPPERVARPGGVLSVEF
jgi:hypothetical protein